MEHTGMVQFTSPGGRFTARATTVKFLLEWAYGIQPAQHSSGPSWIGTEQARFFTINGETLAMTTARQTHPLYPGRTGRGVVEWRRG